jgi:pyrimidine operon attenuation protein / uracil phosphoribosyltransferase
LRAMDSGNTENTNGEYTVVMDGASMEAHIRLMAREIVQCNPEIHSLVMLGILRRGRPLADRLAGLIGEMAGITPPVGSLATTLYRDDVRSGKVSVRYRGETHFDFNVDDSTVLLVDDVLAAGRTIRAAMDEVMDYGRPERIQLACLVDRGRRELPIQPDYLGWTIATQLDEWVHVRLRETDGEDMVLLKRKPAAETAEEGA